MTQAARFKGVVRARAEKTGENHTAARRVKAAVPLTPVRDPRVPRGQLSDRTARKSTGHGLDHWFEVLDAFGQIHGHTKAAEYLYSGHQVQAWHAQMITVTWERARGLRRANQSCTGTFQVSVSRSIEAPVEGLVGLINDGRARKRWLKTAPPALARALEDAFAKDRKMELKKPGYARMRYKWLSSVVELRVNASPGGKSTIVADSSDLPDADAVKVRREAFAEALDRLRDLAAGRSASN